jgi:YYY domain-containing protein
MGLNLFDIAVWWLVLEVIGFIILPVSFYLCRNLLDHGYSVSKPLGLLLVTYLSWIISIVLGYSYISVLLSLVVIAAFSLLISIKKGFPSFDKKYIIKFEIIFLFAFLIFAFIRAYSPDIYWTGGEKFMDMTFINSLLRTTEFPPLDPWMSGTLIYYYYFGYLVISNLMYITGILPSVAFNLATASFFALSFTTCLGIGYNLTEKIKYGIITAFFVTIAGNLVGFFQLMDIFRKENAINNMFSFNYWTSSRVIPDTINEFPFFSFLQGDLHAHMISITFQLLVILLLLDIMKSNTSGWDSILIMGLSIGFLYPLNSWDYPVYLILAILVITYNQVLGKKDYLKYVASIAIMTASSYLFYLPYHLSYKLDKMISLVPSGRTSLIFYIAIYGLFLFLIYSFVLKTTRDHHKQIFKLSLILLAIAALITIFELKLFILNYVENPKIIEFELLILLIPLLVLAILSIFKEKDKNNVFILILILAGVFTSLFCEFFYIQDALGSGSPIYIRLNTVFKMYIQNWILWGICAGSIVYHLRDSFISKKKWGLAVILLILVVSIYPVFATIGKSGSFKGVPGLDGASYAAREHPQDFEAILWFRNITGQPVVLQAPGNEYEWNTAITAFTGLPTVIGWAGHELNWRFPIKSEIDNRWSDVGRMYTSGDIREVEALLIKYNVSYVYFGEAEIKRYSNPRLFEEHTERFEKVFEYGDVEVFKVKNFDR